MHPSQLRHTVRALVEPTIQRMGFDLVAVELVGGRGKPTLRLSIDGPIGVGADDCAKVSVRLGPLLDADDPLPGAYTLEVSSPGIERPVQRLADFERFLGCRVRIRMEEGLPRRRYTGRLVAVAGDDVQVDVDGQIHTLAFDAIDAATLDLTLEEFQNLTPGPGASDVDAPDPAAVTGSASPVGDVEEQP